MKKQTEYEEMLFECVYLFSEFVEKLKAFQINFFSFFYHSYHTHIKLCLNLFSPNEIL